MPVLPKTNVDTLISGIDNLPTPPVVFSRINEAIANPYSSAYQIAAIVSEDPAISAKILRISNSAFYGSRMEITSVKQAIITIGMEAIRSLILSTSVFDAFKKHPRLASFQEEFWRHSLSVGSACRVLMRKISNEWIKDADRVFSAGLLHDIGKLVMICYLPKEWDRLEAAMKADARPVYIVEKELFDYTHAEIGSALAGRWNLPHTLRNAIALHHSPGEIPDQDALSRLVYCGNLLSHRVFDLDDPAAVPLDRDSEGMISRLGLKPDGFDQLKSLVIEEYAKSEVFLEISRGL